MRALHPYPAEIERKMKELYHSLNEKDQRRYAAIEAAKLGYGGPAYVSRLLGCDEQDDSTGQRQVLNLRRFATGQSA